MKENVSRLAISLRLHLYTFFQSCNDATWRNIRFAKMINCLMYQERDYFFLWWGNSNTSI